ncbi:MAG: hypothetical protein KF833_16100 [Verrucomicrobiae bacterium]|nr:hypothetical protein [Verrucomicrobiae bacterium]
MPKESGTDPKRLLREIHEPDPDQALASRFGPREEEALKERLSLDERAAQLTEFNELIELRRVYADKIFRLAKWWVIALYVVLILNGALGEGRMLSAGGLEFELRFLLSDAVLLALIAGTAVAGLAGIIANHLFPRR